MKQRVTSAKPNYIRKELTKRTPCFHCSKSLYYDPRKKRYLAFYVEVNGYLVPFHLQCLENADFEDFEEVEEILD